MAFTTALAPREKFLGAGVIAALAARLDTYMQRQSRAGEIAALQALSDAELAAQGLSRDRIAYHVFRDRFYI